MNYHSLPEFTKEKNNLGINLFYLYKSIQYLLKPENRTQCHSPPDYTPPKKI